MRNYFLLFTLFFIWFSPLKSQHSCSVNKTRAHLSNLKKSQTLTTIVVQENNYDVSFYHLNLNAERNSLFISGNVRCLAKVVSTSLDTFACLLHQNHTIDSVYVNGSKQNFVRQDSLVKISIGAPLLQNQLIDVTVYYKGTCPAAGTAAIGNGYNIDTSPSWGNEVAWTLSESFVAYEWFPCKQLLTDKIDSSYVYVTTDSSNRVGSNGRLKNIVTLGNKKRFEWKSTYPIDYYLISMSIAKYKEYNLYAKPLGLPNDSILIQNYIYDNAINNPNWISGQKAELDEIKPTIELFSNLFGLYPFYKEKYGHCMAPLGGGMEHQTMTTLGFFNFDLDAHELGHQWWGDYVTCKSWGDIWINEGWASYSEYIANQYLVSKAVADNNMLQVHTNVMSSPNGSVYFTNADTLNTTRIFSSRLTYDKGGAIAHSIRFELNDDTLFFNICKGFLATYQYSVASVIDFKNYLNANSGKNFDQFFNQWYYGEGYPTFNVKWNQVGNTLYLKSTQTTSFSSSVPLFITPLEYKIYRSSLPDTIIRVMHAQSTEMYPLSIPGTVMGIDVDPNNWILNKTIGPVKDVTLVNIEEQENNVTVFVGPNPTSDKVYINMYTNPSKVIAQLNDINGKLIKQQSFYNQTELDVSALPNGVYTITIKNITGQLLYSKKIIKA